MPSYYLALNGTQIPCQSGGLMEPSLYGETVRMWDNTLRSTEEPVYRTRRWQFTTGPLKGAEWAAIEAFLRSAAVMTASGNAVSRGSTTVAVLCQIGEVVFGPDGDGDITYTATFQLFERSTASSGVGAPTTDVYLSATTDPYDDGVSYRTAPVGGIIDSGYVGVGGPDPAVPLSGCGSGTPCSTPVCPPVTTLLQKWITPRLLAGMLDGPAFLNSSGIGINPWGTWYRMSLGMQVSLVRAGAIVAGPFPFTTSGVFFAGGPVNMQTVTPFAALAYLDDDRFMFQQFTVMGMNGCRAEDGFRPSMGTAGNNCQIIMPGIIALAP